MLSRNDSGSACAPACCARRPRRAAGQRRERLTVQCAPLGTDFRRGSRKQHAGARALPIFRSATAPFPKMKMAVRQGFEPWVPFKGYNALAKRRFRPLSHLTDVSQRSRRLFCEVQGRWQADKTAAQDHRSRARSAPARSREAFEKFQDFRLSVAQDWLSVTKQQHVKVKGEKFP